MPLTKTQSLTLERYQSYREKAPTFGRLLQQSWQAEAVLVVASALAAWVSYTSHAHATAYFILGLLVGALARDVGTFRRVLQIWPVLSQVLDWQKVDQLLNRKASD